MKPLYFLIISISFIALVSCSKQKEQASAIYIRIQNSSSVSFENVVTNDVAYGRVTKGRKTSYQLFKNKVIAYPGAVVYKTKNDSAYAGAFYCGTPPVPYLENGWYTLIIKDGVVNINPDFTVEFIKD